MTETDEVVSVKQLAEPARETGQLMRAIIAAAADPQVSPEKMTALYDLHVKILDRAARLEFASALARAQANFPIIERNGRIVVYSKADRERAGGPPQGAVPQQETPYALYEDVVAGITKPLSEEGLSLAFRIHTIPTGDSYRIVVVGVLKHRDGWSEEVETPPLVHDSTGSKNAVQAVKSTFSYGKRMAAEMLTNVVSRGDDDDGAGGAKIEKTDLINDAQFEALTHEIEAQGGRTMAAVLDVFQIESLSDLPAARYDECVQRLAARKAAAKKR